MGMGEGVEVELKFRVDDPERVRRAVRELGGEPEASIEQVDTYFGHPARDFAKTDEALRVRIVGEAGCVTYKGPLLDSATKSREETELWFRGGAADGASFGRVLEQLGFTAVRSVRKRREPWALEWQGYTVEIAVDDVEGLGTFVELETGASTATFDAAKEAILSLGSRLELNESERRSYLSLLLSQDSG